MEQHHDEYSSASGSGNWRVVFGLLAGAAIGTGIGILVAPASGSDLRHRLAKSASNLPRGLARVGRSGACRHAAPAAWASRNEDPQPERECVKRQQDGLRC
jgi:hypothetical protein